MALVVLNGPTIAAGESLSDALDCNVGSLVRITLPAAWTDAPLSFEMSTDGEFYNEVCDASGREITANVLTGAALVIDEKFSRALGWLKVRSGTKERPVPQAAERAFAVAMRTLDT